MRAEPLGKPSSSAHPPRADPCPVRRALVLLSPDQFTPRWPFPPSVCCFVDAPRRRIPSAIQWQQDHSRGRRPIADSISDAAIARPQGFSPVAVDQRGRDAAYWEAHRIPTLSWTRHASFGNGGSARRLLTEAQGISASASDAGRSSRSNNSLSLFSPDPFLRSSGEGPAFVCRSLVTPPGNAHAPPTLPSPNWSPSTGVPR
ncbi:hypothetical protein BT67DRAFT_150035 [Trichocladium antarcticum]|uniref:Uncharacterized protein n=1 Tax=Trichocladium antarcticum TaxID=1450529 RepID=A0AAN6UEV2_9PEZI|nr:hypothetical protein BT67DRAFT_150035 [Trichocladium antarcticum]